MFSANVVNFINQKPANLGFKINKTPAGPTWIDVDIDVSITHPFPGMHQYDGYDVRGVFIGDGSGVMKYNNVLTYAVLGTDQFMLDDPASGDGGPDGYTRWFNPTEFLTPGLFGYTPGKFATPGYKASAIVNPYKYFADGLGPNDSVWTWLNAHTASHGVFTAGTKNTRNYYLRFPNAKTVKYNYAIVANWESETAHPSNAVESVAVSTQVTDDLYYVSGSDKGGNLTLDIDVFNWSAGMMEQQKLFVESSVLSSPHEFSPSEMTPTGGTEQYSTYHLDIPADNIQSTGGNEFWVIAQNPNANYKNGFGITNGAGEDPLAAFFRYNLYVSNKQNCPDPTVTGINPDTMLTDVPLNDTEIDGTNLLAGTKLAVKLAKAGQPDIPGTDIKHVDDTKITADFDLTGAATGKWDVVVTNGCGKTATGAALFEVYSCGTLQGFTTDYHAVIITSYPDDMPTFASGCAGTQTGTPFAIACGNRAETKLGAIPTSTMNWGPAVFWSDPTGGGLIDRDVVCDSQNKVYFTDNTNYNRLRYCQFNETTGFGAVTNFGNITAGWSIYRITIDENDNPVVLGVQSSNMRVFHWNGSTWNTTDVPSSVVQGLPSWIGDFDWNPLQHHYVFLQQAGPSGVVTLYAIDTAGTLISTVDDIIAGNNFTGLPGIYIDVKSPSCDIVAWGSWANYGTWAGPFTRMTAAYTGLVTTMIGVGNYSSPNLNIAAPRGQVAKGSGQLCLAAHYINVYAKVPLPGDW
jgi:hypothetical protein